MRDFGKSTVSRRALIVAAIACAAATPSYAQTASADDGANESSDIVVTAQKREQRLQDVPVPVTALSADALVAQNQVRMQDFARTVPGFTVDTQADGKSTIAIRGLTTGAGYINATVGTMIDGIPYGSSIGISYGPMLSPDLDPASLSRVEVLRGPQGTLYGASSIGGLINYVMSDPSTTRLSGNFSASGERVDGGGSGYAVRGAIDIPLSTDRIGLSIGGFARRDPGYVDNATQGKTNVNDREIRGARVATLVKFSEDVSLKLSGLIQKTSADDSAAVITDGRLSTKVPLSHNGPFGTGGYETIARLASAVFTAQLGAVELVSLTGYSHNSYKAVDNFPAYADLSEAFFGFRNTGLAYDMSTKKFSQEIHIGSEGKAFDWMVGGFYTRERTAGYQAAVTYSDTGAVAGNIVSFVFPQRYQEIAGFVDLTWHATDKFDIQVGARQSRNKQRYDETDDFLGTISVLPTIRSNDSSFTYLVTPSYKFSRDTMLYARVASGYRTGGPNPSAVNGGLPPQFKPDTTTNYEIGIKGSLWDRRISYDLSVYHIDWSKVQLTLTDPVTAYSYVTNGGRAKSDGAELALRFTPTRQTVIALTASYNNAKLKQDLPAGTFGSKGDRLPLAARYSGSLSIDHDFVTDARLIPFAGLTASYTGSRYGVFTTTPPPAQIRPRLPSYALADLRAGVRLDGWTVSAYVDNVTDKRGIVNALPESTFAATINDPFSINVTRPRTFGVRGQVSF